MAATLDLEYSEEQDAIRLAVGRFCTQHQVEDYARRPDEAFPRALWQQLAQLGVFSPAAPGDSEAGGALAISAICETLGEHAFPGPIAATYLAIQVMAANETAALIEGATLVSLSAAGSTLLPWGTEADLYLVIDDTEVSVATAPAGIEAVATLGGETWGRAKLRINKTLPKAARGVTLANIADAAYLAGIAWRLLQETSKYVATRKQFGQALGEFQAVAHPLADCAIAITAARTLARAAACAFDISAMASSSQARQARTLAAGAVLSAARAGLKTSFACHQAYAGIGVTLEGPAFYLSRRIRQCATQATLGNRERELLLADAGLGE